MYYSTCIALRDSINQGISVSLFVRFYGTIRKPTPVITLQDSDPDHTIGENQADCYNKSAPNVGTEVGVSLVGLQDPYWLVDCADSRHIW